MLRRWRVDDAEAQQRAVAESADHLRPWMAWMDHEPLAVDERRLLLAQWELRWLGGGDANFAIVFEGWVIGSCGLHRRRTPDTLEIGYWVHPDYLGRGLATRAAQLLTDAAFGVPGVARVEIHHDKANVASRRIPDRLGYRFLGERPDEVTAPAEVGIDCVWRVSREDWAARRRDAAPQPSSPASGSAAEARRRRSA